MRRMIAAVALLLAPFGARAQSPKALAGGWMMRPDLATDDASKASFTTASRGWRIATGPVHAIFYRPATKASGTFTATLDASLVGPPGQFPEGYGMIVGGKNLDGAAPEYLYFLVQNNGMYTVKRRTAAGGTPTLINWTASPAIKMVPAGATTNAQNVLRVEAHSDSVRFFVNGTRLAAIARGQLALDGVVGLRVNHNLSVQVMSLAVTK